MSLKVTQQNSISVYTVSGSHTARSLPDWLARKRKRSLRDDAAYNSRIELIQDFEFEEASQCVRVSEDGEYAMATGTYKPQQRIYHLPSSALKYARHTGSLNLKFVLLSTDYTKSLHLQTDRSLEFHTAMGCHHVTRIPRYGRDLAYLKPTAQVVVAAEGQEVYRLDLEAGRFLKPFTVGGYDGGEDVRSVECVGVADGSHGLLAFGTDVGTTEFWDPRSRNRVGLLGSPTSAAASYDVFGQALKTGVTALEFNPSGLTLATGNSAGIITLYDIRSPNPLLSKDQGYGFPIKTLKFLHSSSSTNSNTRGVETAYETTSTPKVLSADKRIIKIWDQNNGKPWTSIEPSVDINDVCVVPNSGMIFTANEGREMHSFLIPALGPSPWWCAHLDTQIEQLADKHINDPDAYINGTGGTSGEAVTYDNYKFLTKPELKQLNLDHLIGGHAANTEGGKKPISGGSLVRPYMHGYFVDQRLYDEARLIADPFEWERERKRLVAARIEKQRESRIRSTRTTTTAAAASKVKFNKRLAERLVALEGKLAKASASPDDGDDEEKKEEVLKDTRFTRLFQNPDFEVDEASMEFRQLNPSTKPTLPTAKTAVEQEQDSSSVNSDSDSGSDSGEEKSEKRRPEKNWQPEMRISTSSYKKANHDTRGFAPSSVQKKRNREKSFGERVSSIKDRPREADRRVGRGVMGEREVTFFASSSRRGRGGHEGGGRGGRGGGGQGGGRGRPAGERRSASGNVFRREGLGK
ncbi:WD40 repeat-like protein [Choiromyces venosus 120613-1]|uniref:WD40 repeat-like protein n=1 Tax=Choiromyces venosus 120613-1 TaxID=1336337 RepID=A0A3N4JHI0_9PEZI|nr:WD40 repeat-like protein [Choiromyces venosus 120613-1]